jgi:acetyl-CoA acyltransferase
MRDAVIVAGVRTAVGRAHAGALRTYRPDDMAAVVMAELLRRAGSFDPALVDDVILGCATPEAEQGRNVARVAALRAGFPATVAGLTVNRFCASGLEAIAIASQRIQAGSADVVIAGGTESMSLIPRGGHHQSPNPWLAAHWPGALTSMGLTAENVAVKYQVSREDQDAFGYRSQTLASAAIRAGRFADEIVPLDVETCEVDPGGTLRSSRTRFDTDEGVRHDTTLASMAKLKPAFKAGGTVTAGNSSQMSDGAAAVLLMEAGKATTMGLTPLARLAGYAVAGVPPELMGMGPAEAMPKVLRQTGRSIADIDLIELNEAFASQSLAVIRQLELDPVCINVNGGAIALGHPLGCTGAKLTVQLVNEMRRRASRYGIVTMCVGGGQGAAGVFERLS